jgi:hypothetical protein
LATATVTAAAAAPSRPQFLGVKLGSQHDFILRYLSTAYPRRAVTAEINKFLVQASGVANPATSARLGELRDRKRFVDYHYQDGTWGLTQAALEVLTSATPIEIGVPAGGDGAAPAESRE